MYVAYPQLQSHKNREPVPSGLLPKTGTHYLVTYSYKVGFLRYLRQVAYWALTRGCSDRFPQHVGSKQPSLLTINACAVLGSIQHRGNLMHHSMGNQLREKGESQTLQCSLPPFLTIMFVSNVTLCMKQILNHLVQNCLIQQSASMQWQGGALVFFKLSPPHLHLMLNTYYGPSTSWTPTINTKIL